MTLWRIVTPSHDHGEENGMYKQRILDLFQKG